MSSQKIHPPKLASRLLTSFLREDLAEEVMGDLEENFIAVNSRRSLFRARLNYWYQVLHYLRPFAIRKSITYINNIAMFNNYFKIGWRNMSRQKMYSSLKVGGFALGISACILIALFIRHELSYDLHYTEKDRIFRVVEIFNNKGKILKGVHLPAPTASAIKEDYPEVELTARLNPVELFGAGNNDIRPDGKAENTYESGFTYADPDILEILDLPMVYGDRKKALREPNTLVMTRRKAEKFFPGENPIGKVMIIRNEQNRPYTVSGVIEDHPVNSHFQYDFLITLSGLEFYPGEQTNWLASNYPTYLLLHEGADPVAVAKKFQLMAEKYYVPRLLEIGMTNAKEEAKNLSYTLQPVYDIHLNAHQVGDGLRHGDERFTWLSGAVAVFILLIACINFINLSTAKSANRAKEVGLRKVVGSYRVHLMNQFLTESVLFSLLSFTVGIFLSWALLPFFNKLLGVTLTFPWNAWWFTPLVIGGALLVGIVAGFYPSFYLSAFKPIDVLRGNLARGSKSAYTRSALVVFQFTTSIILMIGTFVVYRQMQFILTTKIGYEKEEVVLVQGTNLLGDRLKTFKEELLRQPGVSHVSISEYLPVEGSKRNGNSFTLPTSENRNNDVSAQFWVIDEDYFETLGIKLTQGRNFDAKLASDSSAVIINEAMAKAFHFDDPLGQQIRNYRTWNIVGVVENFHFASFKKDIEPLAMVLGNSPAITSVKISPDNRGETLDRINAVWREFAPQQPIRYVFLDDNYARMYDDVTRMGLIFTTFAVFAIIVACLGLFGLSSFLVEQRGKEISIRLVLGASVNAVFRLLTQNFIKLIIISLLIAAPIAWWLMDRWLQDFVYRTKITTDIFVIVAIAAIGIALATISYQAIRAAFVNPVDKLRSE